MFPNPIKLYEFVEVTKSSELHRDHVILDLGCGKGHWTMALAQKCAQATGVDASERQIEVARRFIRNSDLNNRIIFQHGRLEELNLPANRYDKVYSFCVLEHIPNIEVVLREVARILKPGGEMHVSVDSLATISNQNILQKHKRTYSVYQYFSRESLQLQFEKTGFETLEIYPILKGLYAKREFTKRICGRFQSPLLKRVFGNYKYSLLRRFWVLHRFRREDRILNETQKGIMLVGRARRL